MRTLLLVLMISVSSLAVSAQSTRQKKPAAQKHTNAAQSKSKRRTLSPLFARLVFVLAQDLQTLRSDSDAPIDETDVSNDSIYTMHRQAVDDEIERMEAFDMKSDGDKILDEMIGTAMLFITHEKLMESDRYFGFNHSRVGDCLVEIKEAARNGYVEEDNQGGCTYNDTVKAEQDAESTMAQAAVDAESAQQQKRIDDLERESRKLEECVQFNECDEANETSQLDRVISKQITKDLEKSPPQKTAVKPEALAVPVLPSSKDVASPSSKVGTVDVTSTPPSGEVSVAGPL